MWCSVRVGAQVRLGRNFRQRPVVAQYLFPSRKQILLMIMMMIYLRMPTCRSAGSDLARLGLGQAGLHRPSAALFGLARLGPAILLGPARLCSARPVPARLGFVRLDSSRPTLAQFRSARCGPPWFRYVRPHVGLCRLSVDGMQVGSIKAALGRRCMILVSPFTWFPRGGRLLEVFGLQ